MQDIEIEHKIKAIIGEHLNMQPQEISADSGSENVDGWDSVKSLSIVLDVEKAFNIRFELDEFEDLTSYKTIFNTVCAHLGR